MPLKWTDTDEIGYRLQEKYPNVNPLSVRFSDLHRWVTQLEGFDDNASASNERTLEAIQMSWFDYYRQSA